MGLVLNASSPALATTNARSNTTASFTPPDGALLLAMWAGNSQGNIDPGTPTPSSSPALSWTQDAWDRWGSGLPQQNAQAGVFHAAVNLGAATTVTVLNGAITDSFGSALRVYAVTGHDPVTPIASAGGSRANSPTSITASYTATVTGSQGFLVVADWNATDTTPWTATAGCTIVDDATLSPEISYAVVIRTDPDGVIGETTSIGLTGLGGASTQLHWAYAELVSIEARSRMDEWTFAQIMQVG